MINSRIFVEKRPKFQLEATSLLEDIRTQLQIPLKTLRYINVYDVFDIEEDVLEKAIKTVFAETMVDDIVENLDLSRALLSWEFLPGQYDQRADSAKQCILLLDASSKCIVRSGTLLVLDEDISENDFNIIKDYCINPVELRVKDLSKLEIDVNVNVQPMDDFSGFIDYNEEKLELFRKNSGMAMSFADLKFVQSYFKDEEKRDPTETEIKVLDTYWSDHCRHTTFETELEKVVISKSTFKEEIQNAYQMYLDKRSFLDRNNKPQTLMDMATIESKYLKKCGKHRDVEVSEEINACSVYIDVDVDGVIEKWLLMFKNETHNHPTEIEPYGGASTCIGGAIRDPLSGRSYVYQATRISGCGDVTESMSNTMSGKLPQRVISKKATLGNSSYGNQIGLSTTFTKEIYHKNYTAKHLELGAVCGAVKAENIRRETLTEGDVIILLGGATGRDGIGGATGSSKEHNLASLSSCAAEVQKGNAPEERKIQRLFRNPEVTKLIKKCNDFGAGGVCVAIGELADGLHIKLEKVHLKYAGLNATEIAISESQERMAVGVDAGDVTKFIELARSENLNAYSVAWVTSDKRLRMTLNGMEVVNLSRDFINTSGVRQKVDALIEAEEVKLYEDKIVTKDSILTMLKDLNCTCQKGQNEIFDATIGSTTVLMPFGGKYQLSPSQASVQKIPVLNGKTDTCSILTYGFELPLMDKSPFIGAMHSVLTSIGKTIACGGHLDSVHFSFQEYFKKLHLDPQKWGDVVQVLLGANVVLDYFEKGAIGGKDSMSGSFNDIDVPNTFVSFACSTTNVNRIISTEFKTIGNNIYLLKPIINDNGYPNLESFKAVYNLIEKEISSKNIVSSYVVENGGWIEACLKMSFGNRLGFRALDASNGLNYYPGAIVVEANSEISSEYAVKLGVVTDEDYQIGDIHLTDDEAITSWTSTLSNIYPIYAKNKTEAVPNSNYRTNNKPKAKCLVDTVKVTIPVFPGTNCEYDLSRAFTDEGAVTKIVVFKNQNEEQILESINELAQEIRNSQILALPGGFSSGDEPDGSAKFIVNVLQNQTIKDAINDLLSRDGLILGICNGFQALIKSGLLPYGEIKVLDESDATLYRNTIHRHVSTIATTRVGSTLSPWLSSFELGKCHQIAMSHGEGRFVASNQLLEELMENGQIAFQYADEDGNATMDFVYNINGSEYAIEGITNKDGRILGKMGHSERYVDGVFKNIYGDKKQSIFKNGVDFFRK